MSSELFAFSIPFRDLAPTVDELRERTSTPKPSHGVPPHVTLLIPGPPDLDAGERDIAPALPLSSRASSVVLFEQAADDRWVERAEFEL